MPWLHDREWEELINALKQAGHAVASRDESEVREQIAFALELLGEDDIAEEVRYAS